MPPMGKKLKHILIIVIKTLLVISVFVCTIVLVKSRQTNRIFVNKYAEFNIAYSDGTTKYSKGQNFGTVNKGDVVTVHLRLPEEPITSNAVLTFFIYHSVTEVYCGETLLDSYGADIDARGDMVSSNYFRIPIPDEAWGGEITIILRVTENGAFNRVKNLGIYPETKSHEYFIDMDVVGLLLGLPMLLLGVVALAVFLIIGRFSVATRKGLYISAFSILSSTWILTKTGVQHMFGLDWYFLTQMEFVAAFTIIIPVLLWAVETEEKGTLMRKLLAGTLLFNVVFFAVATALHITNILHYSSTLLMSNILTLVGGVLLLVFSISRIKRGEDSDRIFFVGMLILFFAGIFDLFRMNLYKYLPVFFKKSLPSVLAMGMLFFIIHMLRSYMAENAEKQKKFVTSEIESRKMEEMLGNTPAGICVFLMSEGLPMIRANDTFFRMFGYTQEQAAAAGFNNMLFPLDDTEREKLKSENLKLIEGKMSRVCEIELTVRKADGTLATILTKQNYHGNGDNRVTANVIDITDRQRMADELANSEKRYRLALTNSGKVFFFFDVPSRTMRLSEELAQVFGLPTEVDNMPDNFIALGLVEPDSVADYLCFYERIIAGDESGESIISCHVRQAPDKVMWYRIAFTTVFDKHGAPSSAIITYEDLSEQRRSEIAAKWKMLNLVSMPEESYTVVEYNLTRNLVLSQIGGLFEEIPKSLTGYDEIGEFMLGRFVYEEDVEAYRRFSDRCRLLEMFGGGIFENSIEYRSLHDGSLPRWTLMSTQMIKDGYSGDVLAQVLFRDIHVERTGQFELRQDVENLRKELENSRIKIMINQMQPHFLYNALSAIQTIIKTDPDYAYQLIYDFTIHLRSSIKALSSDAPIPFNDELKNIKAYLNIERMRFGDSLRVNYEIDCDDFSVIPLSIQPLAENAARHGVYPKGEQGGTVTIRTYETANAYVVEIEDDGVGFDVNKALDTQGDSVGLKSLIFRLKNLMNANVIIDSRTDVGTKITVTIPKGGNDICEQ